MIDHLTKYEGIVFGGLIALGMSVVTWADYPTTVFSGGTILGAAVLGGCVTLLRALAQKPAGSIYFTIFTLGLFGFLVRLFVFPSPEAIVNDKSWIAILSLLGCGVVGIALNALIREDPKSKTDLAPEENLYEDSDPNQTLP